jgi:branched-chain amino acid transport system permease protein
VTGLKTKQVYLKSYLINFIAVVIIFLVLMLLVNNVFDSYFQGIIMMIFINIILATSLNLTVGCLGEFALGHAGFMSVGAYAAAIFSKSFDLSGMTSVASTGLFIAALLVGGVCAAVMGLIVGIPALRTKGDYLAIITLGFGEIIRVIIENMEITGGAQGLKSIPKLANLSVAFWVAIAIIAVMYSLMRSRHGRAILSIREDDIAAAASGVPVTFYKVFTFTTSAFFAGIAGGIYAHYIRFLPAKYFNFNKSIEILVIVVLGGMGSFTGAIIAAIVLTILPEALRAFSEYRMLVYAVALILVMIFKPSGLFGRWEFSIARLLMGRKAPVKERNKEVLSDDK